MEKILFHSLSHNNRQLFDNSARDACNEPQILLKQELKKLNIEYDTSDNHSLDNCRWIIFSEIISTYQGLKGKLRRIKRSLDGQPSRNVFQECLNKGMQDKMVLILSEPASVLPENWNSIWHDQFPIIFTWNDKLVDGHRYIKIPAVPLPEYYPVIKNKSFSQKKLLVNISMNKSSTHPNQLYSERIKAINFFEQNHPEEFDLYGKGWNQPKNLFSKLHHQNTVFHSSYRKPVKHKWEVLHNYRFSICYENIRGELGYVTEKIFDSMRCSCVPIYLGADNVSDYVDSKAFVDRRDFSSNQELAKYLFSVDEKRYNDYLDAMKNYLNTNQFGSFLSSTWIKILITKLDLVR